MILFQIVKFQPCERSKGLDCSSALAPGPAASSQCPAPGAFQNQKHYGGYVAAAAEHLAHRFCEGISGGCSGEGHQVPAAAESDADEVPAQS